jgi:tetratricopeptide (TPR) repeat protein
VQQELGDHRGLAMAWNNLCMTATGQRDFGPALEYAENSRREAEQVGAERGLAIAANNTATVLRCTGRLAEAEAGYAEALELFGQCSDHRGEAAALFNLAFVAAGQDRKDQARELYLRSLRLYRDLQLEEGELDILEAWAALDPAESMMLLRLAERERRRLGAPVFVPDEADSRDLALATARTALAGRQLPELTHTLAEVVDQLLSGGRSPLS